MSKICPKCNKAYEDSLGFCSDCGSPLADKPEGAPVTEERSIPPYQPVPTPTYQAAPKMEAEPEKLYPAVSTAMYFWLNIAMVIPFVGFILSIVLTCAPKNASLKNYAKAYLIANLIALGIAITGLAILSLVGGSLIALTEDLPRFF
ncbi:MAG: zinc ribbon domain-containing protein [Clostridia bacterium]|nr:zinc ribbon domain-containing protein [Clostridia bacterium]